MVEVERVSGMSMDIEGVNKEKLMALFPQCFNEGKLNIDKLLNLCGEYIDNDFEKYKFEWKGKSECYRIAGKRSTGTLRPCKEESVNFDTTKNMYIEGDNLEVLKLLQASYYRKVKMIYIDPPYNTGNDFVYEDDFADPMAKYKEVTGQTTKSNPETMGRYHTNWLNMMYPRLRLASNLLRDDGVIFISIDDNEVINLRKLCDEVFGEENFVGQIIWQTATDNNPSQIALEHEYIICYVKNKADQPKWLVKSTKAQKIITQYNKLKIKFDIIEDIQKELKKWIKDNEKDLQGVAHYSYIDEKGVYYPGNSSNTKPGGYTFDIIHPITGKVCNKPDYGYRWTEQTFWNAANNGDVEWGKDENTIPKIKKRIETATEMLKSYYYEDNRYWTKYLNNMFGKRVFENPKSVNLLLKLSRFVTNNNDIILDFFSGSATTAHAVMQLNAEDGGNRQFIMVQLPELCDEKSEAFKAGYNNICEIGKERIRRAGAKIAEQNENVDTGFKVFKLDTSNLVKWDSTPTENTKELTQRMALLKDTIKPDRNDLDMVYETMLKLGIPLDYPVTEVSVNDKKAYSIGEECLVLICLDYGKEGITADDVKTMCEEYVPAKIVASEQAFKDDVALSNAHYILKDHNIEMKLL